MGQDTQDEMESLRKENQSLCDELKIALGRQKTFSDQMYAVVNHAAMLRKALAYASDYLDESDLNSIGYQSKAHQEMKAALSVKLETSPLASHVLIKQAEAISYWADRNLGGIDLEMAEAYAGKLRQQADNLAETEKTQ